MQNVDPSTEPDLKTTTVDVQALDKVACQVQIRDLPPLLSDEKPWNGGKDRGPSPLEIVLSGLGA